MEKEIHILVADDDHEDRAIMADTFEEIGFSGAYFVEDGSLVLDYLSNLKENNISLIILDLNMPCLNGTETLRALKAEPRYKEIPVIIFSTSVNTVEKQNCADLGALSYIAKPSRYSEYKEVCKMLIGIAMSKTAALRID
jgi:CheY-like chemotaxis protein